MSAPVGPSEFPWSMEVAAVAGDVDENDHVDNMGVARMLHVARSEWFGSLGNRRGDTAYVVRTVFIAYEAEGFPHQRFTVGVGARERGRTSITLDQALFADDRLVATATAVHVMFSRDTRRAVEIWPELLTAIERRQGAPLPPRGS